MSDQTFAERQRDLPWLIATLCLCGLALASRTLPVLTVILIIAASTCLSRVRVRLFVNSIWIRRVAPISPYLCALGLPLPEVQPNYWIVPFALLPALIAHGIKLKQLKLSFNPVILAHMKPESASRRWSESLYYALPAVSQEYLFRGVLFAGLMTLALPIYVIVALTTLAFLLDHAFSTNAQVRPTLANVSVWTSSGLIWGAAVALGAPLWATMLGHLILNLPAAILPHLRGKNKMVGTR